MKKLILVLSGALLCHLLSAQENAIPTTAMSFCAIDNMPASIALGGQYLGNNLNTKLFSEKKCDINISWQNWQPKTIKSNHIYGNASYRFGKRFNIGLDFLSRTQTAYDILDENGNTKGQYTPSELNVGAGLSFLIINNLAANINVHYISSKLSSEALLSTFYADLLLTWNTKYLSITAGAVNIGPSIKRKSDKSYPLPSAATIQGIYNIPFGLSLYLNTNYYFIGGLGASIGAQYGLNDMLFVRAGYHLGTGAAPIPSFASIGLGAKFFGVHIDLSYLTASEALGNTLAIGLGYSF